MSNYKVLASCGPLKHLIHVNNKTSVFITLTMHVLAVCNGSLSIGRGHEIDTFAVALSL